MHSSSTLIANASPAAVLVAVLLLHGIGRFRHRVVHALPDPAPNWHDVGPEVAALRRRSRWWRLAILMRRALVIAGIYIGWFVVERRLADGPATGEGAWLPLILVLVGGGFALTPLCRKLSHPMYSPPHGARGRRERHSLHGSLLRISAAALYYPALLIVMVPVLLVTVAVAVMAVIGEFGAFGGIFALLGVAAGLLALKVFTAVVRKIDQRGLRYRSPLIATVLNEDQRPYFLYLRTFQDDAIQIRASGTSRRGLITALSFRRSLPFEEVIAWRVQHYGPIIAANDPNAAGLATLGAAKMFLSTTPQDKWKHEVEHCARNSRAVLVSAAPFELRKSGRDGLHGGVGDESHEGAWYALHEGVQYELEMLGEKMPPHPMVLVVPPDRPWTPWPEALTWANRAVRTVLRNAPQYRPERTVAQRWATFSEFVEKWPVFQGIRDLNATGAAHLLLYVPGEGWSAWGAERRTEWTYAVSIMQAMEYAKDHWPAAPASSGRPPSSRPVTPPPHRPPPYPWTPAPVVQRKSSGIPGAVRRSLQLMILAMALYIPAAFVATSTIHQGMQSDPYGPVGASGPTATPFGAILVLELAVPLMPWIWIAWLCSRGSNRARSAATVMFGLGLVVSMLIIGRVQGSGSRVMALAYLAPALASVALLWRGESSAFFETDSFAKAPPQPWPGVQWQPPVDDQTPRATGQTSPHNPTGQRQPPPQWPSATPFGQFGPEKHKVNWHKIPVTVRTSIGFMCAGMAAFATATYIVLYRLLHAAQAAPSTLDPVNTQIQQMSDMTRAPVVALLAGSVLALWIWTTVQCRRGNPMGRVVSTYCFGLTCLAVLARLLFSSADLTLSACCVLLVLFGLVAVALLWSTQSTSHFVKTSNLPASEEPHVTE